MRLCLRLAYSARPFAPRRSFGHTYDAPVQPGNQGFTGNLGLDMGAFDSNGNGFSHCLSDTSEGQQDNTTITVTSNDTPPGTAATASVYVNSWV